MSGACTAGYFSSLVHTKRVIPFGVGFSFLLPSPLACPGDMNFAGLSLSLLSSLMLCLVLLYILPFIEGVASFSKARKSTSSEELDASYDADSVLALSALCFLAFSLSLPSHLSFPSILVVGPHKNLLSPGPLVTINNQSWTPLKNQSINRIYSSIDLRTPTRLGE